MVKLNSNIDYVNIGQDLDGVSVPLLEYEIPRAEKHFSLYSIPVTTVTNSRTSLTLVKRSLVNPSAYSVEEQFGCTHLEDRLFWTINIWPYCLNNPPRDDLKPVLEHFIEMGYKNILNTARVYVGEDNLMGMLFRYMANAHLKKYGIDLFEQKYWVKEKTAPKEKSEVCINAKLDYMFEDRPDIVEAISNLTRTHVLCYRNPYNEKLPDETNMRNVTMVSSHTEGMEIIDHEVKTGKLLERRAGK